MNRGVAEKFGFIKWGLLALIFLRLVISGKIYPLSNYLFLIGASLILLLALPRRGDGRWISRSAEMGFLLFFAAAGLSISLGIYPHGSMTEILSFIGYLMLALAVSRVFTPRDLPAVSAALVLAGSLSALMALRQYFGGFESTLNFLSPEDRHAMAVLKQMRVFGLSFSPDMLAGMIAALLPLGLALLLSNVAKIKKPEARMKILRTALPTLALLLMISSLLLTRSMGGILAALSGMALFILISPWFKRLDSKFKIYSIVPAILIAALLCSWIIVTREDQLQDLSNPDNPITMRLENWRTGLEIFKEQPLTGVGLGNFGLAYLQHRREGTNEVKYAHNNYLQVLCETGPMGLAGFVVIALSFLVFGLRAAAGERPEAVYYAGFLSGGAAFLAHSLIDFDLYVPEVASIFFIGLGLLLIPNEVEKKKNHVAGRLAWALAAILIIIMAVAARAAVVEMELRRAGERVEAKEYSEALPKVRAALRLDPHNDLAQILLAQVLRGDTQKPTPERDAEIVRAYATAIAINPRYPFHHRDLAVFFLERKRNTEALEQLNRAIDLYPAGMDLHQWLGRAYMTSGKYPDAEKALQKAAACGVHNADVLFDLAHVLSLQGKQAQALPLLKDITARYPDTARYWLRLALTDADLGEWQQADMAYEKLRLLTPDKAEGYFGQGLAAYQLAEFNRAIELMDKGLAISPEDALALRILGLSLARSGQTERGLTVLDKALKKNPADSTVRNWLQKLQDESTKKPDEIK